MPGDKWWSFANTRVGGPNIEMTKKKKNMIRKFYRCVSPFFLQLLMLVFQPLILKREGQGRAGKGFQTLLECP